MLRFTLNDGARDDVVTTRLINGHRLRMAGITCLHNFRDTLNAYRFTRHECVLGKLDTTGEPYLHDPIRVALGRC